RCGKGSRGFATRFSEPAGQDGPLPQPRRTACRVRLLSRGKDEHGAPIVTRRRYDACSSEACALPSPLRQRPVQQQNRPVRHRHRRRGNLLAADYGNNRVQKFNSAGSFLSTFGATGAGNGQLYSPQAVAVDSSGNIGVTDSSNNRVQEFNSSGSWLLMVLG